MFFLEQFGINKHLLIFPKTTYGKLHSPYGLVWFFLVFEKFTHAYLFQIALEIMWLPILISVWLSVKAAEWLKPTDRMNDWPTYRQLWAVKYTCLWTVLS